MTRDKIIKEAKRIAAGVKKPYVTRHDLMRGGLTNFKVLRHFDRWTELYKAAGLTRYPKNVYVSDEKIFRAMHAAFLKLKGVKTRHQMVRIYGHSSSLLMLRFGKWRDALVAFRRWCEVEEPGFPYFSELPEVGAAHVSSPPSSAFATATADGPRPSPAPGRERGTIAVGADGNLAPDTRERGAGVTRDRFSRQGRPKKVWAVTSGRKAVTQPARSLPCGHDGDESESKGVARREMGAFINFRCLAHAPVNEAGVILLFGMIAGEIGYSIDNVQGGFPDCEGKRRVSAERWERVRIEFEYRSRNFVRHQHDPKGCDLIVCWEHDWGECPLEVIELKSVIAGLPGRMAA